MQQVSPAEALSALGTSPVDAPKINRRDYGQAYDGQDDEGPFRIKRAAERRDEQSTENGAGQQSQEGEPTDHAPSPIVLPGREVGLLWFE